MKIVTGKPLSLNETGKRPRQEDYIMPGDTCDSDDCFIVCDGLGGHGHGDIASRIVAESLYASLSGAPAVDKEAVNAAVTAAYDALDIAAAENDIADMGTTMTTLCLTGEGYVAAHIGDSRIYHIRPSLYPDGCILYKSWDHSLVNMLVKLGEITEEEAENSNEKNVLFKAVKYGKGAERNLPTVHTSPDVLPGDYFFLCSDGVWGCTGDSLLSAIISDSTLSDEDKITRIRELCAEYSDDNYTCWLIPIADIA